MSACITSLGQVQANTRQCLLPSDTNFICSTTNLTGILQGNGSEPPTTALGTANYLAKWSATDPYLKNSLLFDNGTNVGLGLTTPDANYNLHIRSPYGGAGTFGGLLIDNNANLDLRGIITLRAGNTVQHRRYIYFENIDLLSGWLTGSNGGNDFILYNGVGHFMVAQAGANGDLQLNASGTGKLSINGGGGIGGGSGGMTLYDGNVAGGVRQFSLDAGGNVTWLGLPVQAKSADTTQTAELSSTNVSCFLKATTKLSVLAVSATVMEITSSHVLIQNLPSITSTALTVLGQQWIGTAGAHSTDYGLTLGVGSFTGSEGYISWKRGAAADEYGRIGVDHNGLMTISAPFGHIAIPTEIAYTPSAVQTLNAGDTLLANATKIRVAGSGGAVTMTSTPTIADGIDGQLVYIFGTSANTLTLQDQGTLAGSNLELAAATRVLDVGDVLVLMFDLTASVWYEVSFSNN